MILILKAGCLVYFFGCSHHSGQRCTITGITLVIARLLSLITNHYYILLLKYYYYYYSYYYYFY